MKKSALQQARANYVPKLPNSLKGEISLRLGANTTAVANAADIERLFPKTYGMPEIELCAGNKVKEYPVVNVGVILSGGQAPGGHNVISGLFDSLRKLNKNNKLYGFLGGPSGLVDHKYMELTDDIIDDFRNTGGFDIIGSGRTKLEQESQYDRGIEICIGLNISAIVIIGGDDSNTNACVLAEYYAQKNVGIQVIGCPKTIDGDLKNDKIEVSFGFDTACKVYSELIGNIQRDANSSKKYWHFIRLMGRSASHITLECALQSQPNMCIISEEVESKNYTLTDIVENIVAVIVERSEEGLNYGTILIPEGVIEFIPAMKTLIEELNDMLANNTEFNSIATDAEKREYISERLSYVSREEFLALPGSIAAQLTLDRDPHGNVQVSRIETEKLLIEMCAKRLGEMAAEDKYCGKFATVNHFFGYEGRCAIPSNFDADYCYSLGYTAALLCAEGKTGYMAVVQNLTKPAEEWQPGGVPITMMMNMERRHGELKPVIQKALVDLNSKSYKYYEANRDKWADASTTYIYPGPIQYFGPTEVCDNPPVTLQLEA